MRFILNISVLIMLSLITVVAVDAATKKLPYQSPGDYWRLVETVSSGEVSNNYIAPENRDVLVSIKCSPSAGAQCQLEVSLQPGIEILKGEAEGRWEVFETGDADAVMFWVPTGPVGGFRIRAVGGDVDWEILAR